MSKLRLFYLILATTGAIAPVVFAGEWQFAQGLLVWNWNFILASLAFLAWASNESLARKDYVPLIALPITALLGFGCGLPLYLFLRSRPMD